MLVQAFIISSIVGLIAMTITHYQKRAVFAYDVPPYDKDYDAVKLNYTCHSTLVYVNFKQSFHEDITSPLRKYIYFLGYALLSFILIMIAQVPALLLAFSVIAFILLMVVLYGQVSGNRMTVEHDGYATTFNTFLRSSSTNSTKFFKLYIDETNEEIWFSNPDKLMILRYNLITFYLLKGYFKVLEFVLKCTKYK